MNNEFLLKNMYLNKQINFNNESNKVDKLKYSDINNFNSINNVYCITLNSYKDLINNKIKKRFLEYDLDNVWPINEYLLKKNYF